MERYHADKSDRNGGTDLKTLIGYIAPSDVFDAPDDFSSEKELEELPFPEGDVENFQVRNGKVYHKPQPPVPQSIGGIWI